MKILFLTLASLLTAASAAAPFKVFILAGQSNMEGKVQRKLIDHQATDPETRELFKHLRKDNQWITRDDVFIKFLTKHGGLTVGYGSGDRTGVELEFGTVVADRFDEPVLLIKTAWGGHSLVKQFRPPSAGFPPEAQLELELVNARKRVTDQNAKSHADEPLPTMDDVKSEYGASYRNMLAEIRQTLANVETLFPSLKGRAPEIAGFVWFQGWNDQYNGAELEYAANLRHLIADVRKDLATPALPVVIGVMGQNGSKPAAGAMMVIQNAQLSMEREPGLSNIKAVRTDRLVDKAAEQLHPDWKDHVAEWEKVGSDQAYHYFGSAIWHLRIGHAFADAMLEMTGDPTDRATKSLEPPRRDNGN